MSEAPSQPFAVVFINLDRDAERRDFMEKQCDALGLNAKRFAAIDGAALPDAMRPYLPPRPDRLLSAGEVGCYASHLTVYQAIADGSIASPALVLEDDVALPDDLGLLIKQVLAALPDDWDIVRLSSPTKRAFFHLASLTGERQLIRYSVSPGSNGALLVSRRGARKFLKDGERDLPIDQDNRRLWAFALEMYGVAPAPIRGNALRDSSIDAMASGQSRDASCNANAACARSGA